MIIKEIVTIKDPLYGSWLDLYQKSFPLNEQLLISEHNALLLKKESEESVAETFLAALDDDGDLVGLALIDVSEETQIASLWYLAIDPNVRGTGLGSEFYRALMKDYLIPRGAKALVIEVESPEASETETLRALAERRIVFYRRLGAELITGIEYMQSVGWQPAIPMYVMIHVLDRSAEIDPFTVAQSVLGDEVKQTGVVALV